MTTINDLRQIHVRSDIGKFLTKTNAQKICEVGVRFGEHLQALLVPCIKEATAVDIWRDTGIIGQNDERYQQSLLDAQYQSVLDLASRDSRVKVIRDFSVSAAATFEDNYLDFVYIDADHTEQAVYEDLHAWWTKVHSGGVVAGHDYCGAVVDYDTYDNGRLSRNDHAVLKFGVIEAVNRFVSEKRTPIHIDNETSFYIVKP